MPWRIACQEQLLPGGTALERWRAARAYGFDGVELRGAGEGRFAARLPELREARAAGAVLPSECVEMAHFIGDFAAARRADAVRQLVAQVDVMAELHPGTSVVTTPAAWGMFSRRLPPFEPPRSAGEDREVLLAGLREVGERAAGTGVVICLEPLNRYEDHMVNTLAAAVDLVAEVALASVRVCADTYHMNVEEADPPAALRAAAPWLAHVQLSDSNRLEPGAGHLDWAAHLAALADAGYEGWLAFECRLSGPAEQVLPRAVDLVRRTGG